MICQPLLDIKAKPKYTTISLQGRSHQERIAEQGLSLRKLHLWIRGERKGSSQRGIREMRRNPGKCHVLETKETKKTFKRLVVTYITWPQQRSPCTRPQKRSALMIEGGTGDLCQLIAVSGNCPTSDHDSTFIVSLAHSVASFQQALGRDLI